MRSTAKPNNQPGQGFTYEEVVPALFALQLYTNQEVTDFEIEFNKAESSKFDDVVVKIETKNGNLPKNLHVAIQLKHAENPKNIRTNQFIEGDGHFVLSKYARSSFCQDIHCSLSDCKLLHRNPHSQKSKYHFILYTNRRFVSSEKHKLTEYTMSESNISDPKSYSSYFDTSSNSGGNIYEFQVNSMTPETTDVKLEDFDLFFSNFSLYTSQKNAKEVESTIQEIFESVFKSDKYDKYIAFFRHCHSNYYLDRKINKNIIRIQLISLLLKPQTLSIYDEDLVLFEEALKEFEVTTINESYEDFEKLCCVRKYVNQVDDEDLYNIGINLKIIQKNDSLTDEKIKQKIFSFHFKHPLIVDYDSKSSEEKETVTPTIILCRNINRNSFVIVGHQVDANKFLSINSFQNLGNLIQQFPKLYEKLEPKLTVHLRRGKSLQLKYLLKDNSHLYNFVNPADVIQMLKGNFYMEEERKNSQEFYDPRKLSKVLIRKTAIRPDEQNMFIISFQGFSFSFKKRFLQSLPFVSFSKFTFTNLNHQPVITANRKLTEEEFNLICKKYPNINIHYLQAIDNNYLQWITTKGHINQIRKHAVIKKFISEEETFSCKKNKKNVIRGLTRLGKTNKKINLICGLSGLGKTKILRRLKDICPLDYLTLFVCLPDYKSNFNEQLDATKCLSIFLDVIDMNGFKQELLQVLKDQKKIIFFLDGFDELHYNEAEHAKKCIKEISQLGFQIWITARDICREDLEKTFNTISITIKPYSTQSEQEKYVEKKLKFLENNSIVPACQKFIANLNTKNKEILELPLHLSMIVEIYEKNNISNVEDLDVASLYRQFIEGKHQQFCKNQKLPKNLKISEPIKRYYTEQYGKAALKICLHQDLLNKIHVFYNTDYDTFLEEDKDPWGLFSTLDGPRFIHQTYAEYFAALWISNNIRENNMTLVKEVFNHFILKNSIMALQILLAKYSSLQDYVKSGAHEDKSKSPLHLAFSTGSYETISFLEDKGANLNQLGDSLMYQLLSNGETEMFEFLVKKGVEINGFYNGLGLLHAAVILNKEDMIIFLIKSNINVNQECSSGSEEYRNLTNKILGTGWEKYIEEGKTALDLAIDYGLVHVVEILLNKNANCNKYQTENALKQARQNQSMRNKSLGSFFKDISTIIESLFTRVVYYRIVPRTRYVRPRPVRHTLPIRHRRQTNKRLQQMPKLTPKKIDKK